MNELRGLWRGKDVDCGEWVTGYYSVGFDGNPYIEKRITRWTYEIDSKTLGECTCGTDKTGELAFEGDLVEDEFDVAIGVIRYGEYKQPFNDDKFTKHIGFYVDWIEGDDRGLLRVDLGYWLPLVKIIGNIHDNPELLES